MVNEADKVGDSVFFFFNLSQLEIFRACVWWWCLRMCYLLLQKQFPKHKTSFSKHFQQRGSKSELGKLMEWEAGASEMQS